MSRRRSKAGETLTETLCAVLVLALAVALLAAMISASFRLDRKTDQAAAELNEAFNGAEKTDPGTSLTDDTVSVKVGDGAAKEVPVSIYGDSAQAASYRMKSEGSTP